MAFSLLKYINILKTFYNRIRNEFVLTTELTANQENSPSLSKAYHVKPPHAFEALELHVYTISKIHKIQSQIARPIGAPKNPKAIYLTSTYWTMPYKGNRSSCIMKIGLKMPYMNKNMNYQ